MAGQPTKYKEEYNEQAFKLCLLGYTDAQLGDFFGVEERTINNWKKAHPSFFQSIKKGKCVADANVASALYKKACGYDKEKTVLDKSGNPIAVETHYPPDTAAAFIWLKNRQPDRWKDKRETQHTIKDDSALFEDPDGNIGEL